MKHNKQRSRKPRHVLVARFSALGDVAMTIPVLYTYAQSNPRTRFTLLTKPGMTRLFVNAPRNLNVIGVELPGRPISDWRALSKAVDQARHEVTIESFVDLHDVLRTKLLKAICRLRFISIHTFDKARRHKRAIIAGKQRKKPLLSTIDRYSKAFPKALSKTKKFNGIFTVPNDKTRQVGDIALFEKVSGPKRPEQRWIGIAPFARHEGKIYPLDLMKKVVDELSWIGGSRIFLFGGGEKEETVLKSWAAEHDNVICVAGSGIGFEGELSLMSHLDLMISMDSANMHLAALTATPTISIWGATHPRMGFTPWQSTSKDYIVAEGFKCQPCSVFGDKPCANPGADGKPYPCLRAISPMTIVEKAKQRLFK